MTEALLYGHRYFFQTFTLSCYLIMYFNSTELLLPLTVNTLTNHMMQPTQSYSVLGKTRTGFWMCFYFEFTLKKNQGSEAVQSWCCARWSTCRDLTRQHDTLRSTANHISPSKHHLWKQHTSSQPVVFTTELMIDFENRLLADVAALTSLGLISYLIIYNRPSLDWNIQCISTAWWSPLETSIK